jgi:hypothetical protein
MTGVGHDFAIDWDRNAAILATATSGRISIQDGTVERKVELTPAQLREGRLVFTPVGNEITVRLEVNAPAKTVVESLQRITWDPDRVAATIQRRQAPVLNQAAATPVPQPHDPSVSVTVSEPWPASSALESAAPSPETPLDQEPLSPSK